jgi:putative hemolysin
MTVLLITLAVCFAGCLVLVTLIQTLYMDSLRLRSRDLPAMTFFKETLEQRIGLKSERGVLAFSLVKHTTIVMLGTVFVGIAARRGTPVWQAVVEGCLASWFVMLAVAYVAPQVLYRKTEGRWLLRLVPLLRVIVLVVRPLTLILEFFRSVVDLGDSEQEAEEAGNHTEHIDALINAGAEEGLFEEEDRKLIHAAVAFGDKTVREVMTARPNVVAIEASSSLEDLRQLLINEQYSRVPVYEQSIDRIIGFVHARDMFELDEEERKGRTVRELLRPVRFVPETKRANDLFREMQEDRAHMAIVIDEYGNTAGLATLEDLVEEILGEIQDEHEPDVDVTQDSSGAYILSGSCDLDRLEDLLEFRPQERAESTTVGGLAAEWLGRVPRVGELIEREGIRMEVLAANDRRVEQLRVTRSERSANE